MDKSNIIKLSEMEENDLLQHLFGEGEPELSDSRVEAADPNLLALDKIGEKKTMPPIDLKEKYKQLPAKNTKKSRHYQLTLNQVERWEELKKYITSLKSFKYGIATLESAPQTGHQHIHFYVRFNNTIALNLKNLQGCHIEKCFGSIKQNVDYIKKTNDPDKRGKIIFEEGELNEKFDPELNPDKKPTIKEVKEMSKEDRENLEITYYNQVDKINILEENRITGQTCSKKVKVIYLWGPSGSGKSLWAKYQFRNTPFDIVKKEGEFWHGVSGVNKACLYDDWRDSHMKPSDFINFIDYTIHTLNVKNGSMKNKYKYIIITSVQDPEMIYSSFTNKDLEPKRQWMRRMKVMYAPDFIANDDIDKMLKELGLLDLELEEDPDDPFKEIDFDL